MQLRYRKGVIQSAVFFVVGKSGGLTSVAASETRLGQTPLQLLGIDLAVLHRTGSDIQSCVTLGGINNKQHLEETGLLVKCEVM